MRASFHKILRSRLFKFTVGADADGQPTEFLVHEEALAQLSAPLKNLLQGELSEAKAGSTTWEHTKSSTFEQLIQFAYSGEYSVPDTTFVEVEEEEDIDVGIEGEESEDERRGRSRSRSQTPENQKLAASWHGTVSGHPLWRRNSSSSSSSSSFSSLDHEDFMTTFYDKPYRLDYLDYCQRNVRPPKVFDRSQSYSSVLLSHAALYVLADLWLIDSLSILTLKSLHDTLCVIELETKTHIRDIVNLARFAYSDDVKGIGIGDGGIRRMVCWFIARNLAQMGSDAGFLDLLEEGGTFVRDLFGMGLRRK